MPGLSSELYSRCRTTLLRCREFESHHTLLTVFVVDKLRPFRGGIKSASGTGALVDQCLAYLIDRHLDNGRPVLPLFLATLRDKYEAGDALRNELDQLHAEIAEELAGVTQDLDEIVTIEIPFVVAAMTRGEADNLVEETVFESPKVAEDERTRFRHFRESLREYGFPDFESHYGKRREDWKPYLCPESTIEEIVLDMVSRINQSCYETPGSPMIRLQPSTADFFHKKDRAKRVQTWEQLRRLGCVLVVDAVSLFHPTLRRTLLQSTVSTNEQAAVLVLFPIGSNAIRINQLIEEKIGSEMELAFSRFDQHLDRLCEIGVGDLRAFRRRLFAILPEAADIVLNQRPHPANRKIMRRSLGKPTGMQKVIFGQRGG